MKGQRGEKVKSKRHMARKGNPISVRLDLSSDSGFYQWGGLFIVIIVIAALVVDPSLIVTDQVRQALLEVILSLLQYVWIYGATLIEEMVPALWGQERCATMGTGGLETPPRSEEETSKAAYIFLTKSQNSGQVGQEATTGPLRDPADGGKPSKSQSCSLAETDARRDQAFGVNLCDLETLKRENTYEEVRQKYPSSDDDARKAVIELFDKNELFGAKLLTHFKQSAPMRALGPDAYHRDLSKRINQIMRCEGKDRASLRDLIDLKFNLEDPQRMKEILTRYFDKHKR